MTKSELGVLGAELLRDGARVVGLVVALLAKADGEGLDRPVGGLAHQRDHRRGVDPARQERAERHVGDHLTLYRVGQQRIEFFDDVLKAVGAQRGLPLPRDRREIPVEMPRRPVRRNLDTLARQKLFHLAVDRLRRRHAGVAQIGRDSRRIERKSKVRQGAQRLQLGGKRETHSAAG